MVFDTITGAASSTATTFGGAALNAVCNFLNGGGSESANIYDDDLNIVNSAARYFITAVSDPCRNSKNKNK